MHNETLTPSIETPTPSRALAPLAPPAAACLVRAARADAAFLAQLIAAARRLPDHRERRRADPAAASARYAAAPLLPAPAARLVATL